MARLHFHGCCCHVGKDLVVEISCWILWTWIWYLKQSNLDSWDVPRIVESYKVRVSKPDLHPSPISGVNRQCSCWGQVRVNLSLDLSTQTNYSNMVLTVNSNHTSGNTDGSKPESRCGYIMDHLINIMMRVSLCVIVCPLRESLSILWSYLSVYQFLNYKQFKKTVKQIKTEGQNKSPCSLY